MYEKPPKGSKPTNIASPAAASQIIWRITITGTALLDECISLPFTILFSYTFFLILILSKCLVQYSKSMSGSLYQKPKLANRGIGNGMRAIFLESSHGSCGTGVFLPQRADTKFQPRKKPG